jgi:membrane protein required for colicin V production
VAVESWPVNPLDLAVLAILLLSAVLAFVRGFVREVLAIAAWVGAALVTVYAWAAVRPWFQDMMDSESVHGLIAPLGLGAGSTDLLADVLAGLVLFLLTLIVLSAVCHYIAKAVRGSALNAIDRSLGFLFGLARGALLVCLAYLFFLWLVPDRNDQPEVLAQARSLPLVERGSSALLAMVPEEMRVEGLEPRAAERPPPLPGTPEPRREQPGGGGQGGYDSSGIEQLIERERSP